MADSERRKLTTTYEYENLKTDKIRLLVLLPGEKHEELWGYFEIACLESHPTYKAISYAWGETLFAHALNLVGGRIAITKAVDTVLRRLRDVEHPIKLWLDAVCINQSNVTEKNPQVAMMARIFGEAREVLIWLGEEQAIDCSNYHMLQVLERWYLKWFDWRNREPPEVTISTILEAWALLQEQDRVEACTCCGSSYQLHQAPLPLCLEELNTIWGASWPKRLWVIQEAAAGVNLTFVYGQHVSGFTSLKRASELAALLSDALSPQLLPAPIDCTAVRQAKSTLTHISRLRNPLLSPEIVGPGHNPHYGGLLNSKMSNLRLSQAAIEQYGGGLLHNLVWCAELSASLAHDKVYAIRSLSQVEDDSMLLPDYQLPLTELWKRVAVHILAKHARSGILLSLACTHACDEGTGDRTNDLPGWVPDFQRLDGNSQKRYRTFHELTHPTKAYECERASGPGGVRFVIDPMNRSILLSPGIILFAVERQTQHRSDSFPRRQPLKKKTFADVTYTYSWTANSYEITASAPEVIVTLKGKLPEACERHDSICLIPGCPFPFVLRLQDDGCYQLITELYDEFAHISMPWPTELGHFTFLRLK